MKKNVNVKKLAALAMLVAMAYVVAALFRFSLVPAAPFLKYDPKDVIIAIGGFLFGPVEGAMIAAVVALLEMVTVSTTGWWGCAMNFISSATFVVPAALLYRKHHTFKGALLGLVIGACLTTGTMLLWNWLVVPIYQGTPRDAVADMLLPVFLPFNGAKSAINAVLTILVYKPVARALRHARLVPQSEEKK